MKECRKDIAQLQEIEEESSELFYYKGLMQLKENNKKAALLSF